MDPKAVEQALLHKDSHTLANFFDHERSIKDAISSWITLMENRKMDPSFISRFKKEFFKRLKLKYLNTMKKLNEVMSEDHEQDCQSRRYSLEKAQVCEHTSW